MHVTTKAQRTQYSIVQLGNTIMSRYAVCQDACFSVNEDRTPLICYRSLFHVSESKKTLFQTAYTTVTEYEPVVSAKAKAKGNG